MTCPVCEGKREVTGILVPGAFRDDPSGQTWATVYCPNDCHRGTVPAMPAQAETGAARRGSCAKCGGLPAEHRYLMGDGPWCACGDGGCECDGYVAEQGAAG